MVNLNFLVSHPLRHMKSSSYSSTLLYFSAIEALEIMFSSCDQHLRRLNPRPFASHFNGLRCFRAKTLTDLPGCQGGGCSPSLFKLPSLLSRTIIR